MNLTSDSEFSDASSVLNGWWRPQGRAERAPALNNKCVYHWLLYFAFSKQLVLLTVDWQPILTANQSLVLRHTCSSCLLPYGSIDLRLNLSGTENSSCQKNHVNRFGKGGEFCVKLGTTIGSVSSAVLQRIDEEFSLNNTFSCKPVRRCVAGKRELELLCWIKLQLLATFGAIPLLNWRARVV